MRAPRCFVAAGLASVVVPVLREPAVAVGTISEHPLAGARGSVPRRFRHVWPLTDSADAHPAARVRPRRSRQKGAQRA